MTIKRINGKYFLFNDGSASEIAKEEAKEIMKAGGNFLVYATEQELKIRDDIYQKLLKKPPLNKVL